MLVYGGPSPKEDGVNETPQLVFDHWKSSTTPEVIAAAPFSAWAWAETFKVFRPRHRQSCLVGAKCRGELLPVSAKSEARLLGELWPRREELAAPAP